MPEGSIPMANLKKEQAGTVAFDASLAFGRRTLLGVLALVATPLTQHAFADTAPVDTTVPIKYFNEALLPMFHWTPRRIEAHVRLCVLALQVQRAAEMRCQLPWAWIAHVLSGLKAVRYRCEGRGIVPRTKITAELSAMLKTLKILVPKQILLSRNRLRQPLRLTPQTVHRKSLRCL